MNLTRTLAAFVISLAVTLIVGRFLIPFLRRAKAGQSIKRDGPIWHMSKEGTPTMGGLMFIAGIFAAILCVCIREMRGRGLVGPRHAALCRGAGRHRLYR